MLNRHSSVYHSSYNGFFLMSFYLDLVAACTYKGNLFENPLLYICPRQSHYIDAIFVEQNISKIIRILKKKSLKNIVLRANFLLLTFLTSSIFKPLYFLKCIKFLINFTRLTARLKNFITGWLRVLGLNEGLIECYCQYVLII